MPIKSVNDFVIRFANVNGSGSASANELFARSVLRIGIPVAPRNIFPYHERHHNFGAGPI